MYLLTFYYDLKKYFIILSNYLITIKSEPYLIYINLFVLWTHKSSVK